MKKIEIVVPDKYYERELEIATKLVEDDIRKRKEAEVLEDPLEKLLKDKFPEIERIDVYNRSLYGNIISISSKTFSSLDDVLKWIVDNGLYCECLEFKRYEADYYNWEEIDTDGIDDLGKIKEILLKEE